MLGRKNNISIQVKNIFNLIKAILREENQIV